MTDSNVQTETWKAIPGFFNYEVSDQGRVRNAATGDIVATSRSHSSTGYPQVKLHPDGGGERKTRSVHSLVLLTFEGPPPPGMECRHWNDDPLDNRWAPGGEDACRAGVGNLLYGTPLQNRSADKARNRPPRGPKPRVECLNHDRCGGYVGKGGRRCHECVVKLGQDYAEMRRAGVPQQVAADRLDYVAVHLDTLGVKYGGWGHCQPCTCSPSATVTLRDRLRRRFGKRGGDGP